MSKRFIVPQFEAQENVPGNLPAAIREILERHGAIRILNDRKRGCLTYALPEENEREAFHAIHNSLTTEISPHASTYSYCTTKKYGKD